MNEVPEQETQSGWQFKQVFVESEAMVLAGHMLMHWPFEANAPLAQLRQKVEEPAQVLHEESQAAQLVLFSDEMNDPEGQLATHVPFERKDPARQPVHCSSLTVEAVVKPDISHEVHFAPQARSAYMSLGSE